MITDNLSTGDAFAVLCLDQRRFQLLETQVLDVRTRRPDRGAVAVSRSYMRKG